MSHFSHVFLHTLPIRIKSQFKRVRYRDEMANAAAFREVVPIANEQVIVSYSLSLTLSLSLALSLYSNFCFLLSFMTVEASDSPNTSTSS